MNEQTLQQTLYDLLAATTLVTDGDDDQISVPQELVGEHDGLDAVSTYAEAGLLTSNAGLVLRMKDGREFQLTIVQSR